jgi:hypothetical protein
VVGIWVPIKHTSSDDLQGVALPYARDARLGGPLVGRNYQDGDELLRYVLHDLPRDVNAEVRLHKIENQRVKSLLLLSITPLLSWRRTKGRRGCIHGWWQG